MSTIYDDRPVLGLEVEPIHEFTPESQRLGRNYLLYPSSKNATCQEFYLSPQSVRKGYYKIGSLVTVYGSRSKSTELGDIGVDSDMVSPITPFCDEIDMTTIPSEENFGMICLSKMFHIYRVLAMFPTASNVDVDRGLRWLSDNWYQLPYEMLVEKYADPSRAKSYLRMRYGEILNSGCTEPPKVSAYTSDKKERDAYRNHRIRLFEYCEDRR